MAISAAEVRKAFADKLKTLSCPHCGLAYTEFAVDWSEAWMEGRRDAILEFGSDERDGPVKLKCELCGGRAMTNAFLQAPRPV